MWRAGWPPGEGRRGDSSPQSRPCHEAKAWLSQLQARLLGLLGDGTRNSLPVSSVICHHLHATAQRGHTLSNRIQAATSCCFEASVT